MLLLECPQLRSKSVHQCKCTFTCGDCERCSYGRTAVSRDRTIPGFLPHLGERLHDFDLTVGYPATVLKMETLHQNPTSRSHIWAALTLGVISGRSPVVTSPITKFNDFTFKLSSAHLKKGSQWANHIHCVGLLYDYRRSSGLVLHLVLYLEIWGCEQTAQVDRCFGILTTETNHLTCLIHLFLSLLYFSICTKLQAFNFNILPSRWYRNVN